MYCFIVFIFSSDSTVGAAIGHYIVGVGGGLMLSNTVNKW